MSKYILTLISIFLIFESTQASDKIDSTYIKRFGHKIAIRPFIKTDFVHLFENSELDNDADRSYITNSPQVLGLGVALNNTIINISYGLGLNLGENKGDVKTESFDFQYHKYARNYVFDIYYQKYKGFYEDSKPEKGFPDLRVQQYGVQLGYVFNNKKYSYKAIFNHDEKQIKSVGSFLAGITVNRLEIKSDSIEVFGAHNLIKSTQFGINGGYAYNWVVNPKWTLGFSLNTGINLGYERVQESRKMRYRFYQTVLPRISASYNKEDWALGFNYLGNLSVPISSPKETVLGVNTGSVSFYFIKRLDIIPFWDKKK